MKIDKMNYPLPRYSRHISHIIALYSYFYLMSEEVMHEELKMAACQEVTGILIQR
jgi:hypothetical protein